jgi:photosystem II stability/assembly factor-like uncharacterized protein
MFRSLRLALVAGLLLTSFTADSAWAKYRKKDKTPPAVAAVDGFASLRWREIGPYRGGRSAAVAGLPGQPNVYYFGSTGGGVWKSEDGGQAWKNVSDGFFGGAIGAVAVAESDSNVVYVGTGEKTVRGNVSHGDGMWKSLDAGKTWAHIGLADSRHIPRVRVHPMDPNTVYAAVLGHLFGPNDERGVFRSLDGGKTWRRILFANRDAGAIDLVLDPSNPRVVYASTWRVRRTPWSLESGGEGSALWKSTDGGDTWKELTRNEGMPKGKDGKPAILGIIGVTVSPSNPRNVYAIVEAEEGGLFRSRDGGDTWQRASDSRDLRQRAWYYSRVLADPQEEDTVYVLNVRFHKSKDGGKTFSTIRVPHGDNHDLWIAPDDPRRMIESNDGGANVSFDGGRTWTAQSNQPTAQFYRVSFDHAFPFRLLGGQQDNSAVRIRHRSMGSGIGTRDWEPTAGGESGHVAAHPKDPDLVFGGSYGGYLTMLNHRTGEFRDVNAWPDNPMGHGAEDFKYRFQWNFPLFFSPHDAETLYAGANVLFRSRDRGASWTAISGDLTRNDASKLGPSGGPITKDNTSVEYYGTIFAAAESQLEPGVLWVGSDDGLIHVSRDNGASWKNVTPQAMPEWSLVNSVEPSGFDKGTVYVAATRYKLDDFKPYLWKSADYGASWVRIDAGIPADQFTRVVRADPVRKGLLYAGTERGVWVSFDDGASWRSLQLEAKKGGLPLVPVTDLGVRDGMLFAATQGRSYWALDELTTLRQIGPQGPTAVRLFEPERTYRLRGFGGFFSPPNQGANPPNGVVVHYSLAGLPEGTKVKLEFLDAQGNSLRAFAGEVKKPQPQPDEVPAVVMGEGRLAEAVEEEKPPAKKDEKKPKKSEIKLPAEPAMNRFGWDLRTAPADDFEGLVLWAGEEGELEGPRVTPGNYEIRLTAGDATQSAKFELVADPRSSAKPEDLKAQYDFLAGARDKLSEMHRSIAAIRAVRGNLNALQERAGKDERTQPLREAIETAAKTMTEVEEALYQTKNRSGQDPLNFPIRLNDKWALLASTVDTGDFAPTTQAYAVRDELLPQIDAQLAKIKGVWEKDLPAINRLAKELDVPAVTPADRK